MKEKIKPILDKIKGFWNGLTKTIKILLIAGGSVIVIGAVVLTIVLNKNADKWVVLFPDMSTEEASEVYLELENMR